MVQHEIFGCCDTANFNKLLERFEQECAEQAYKNRPVLAPPKTAANAQATDDGSTGTKKTPVKRAAGSSAGGAAAAKKSRAK